MGVVSFQMPVPANSRKSRTWAVQRAMVSPLPGFGFVISHLRADPGDDVFYGAASRFARPKIAEPARDVPHATTRLSLVSTRQAMPV